MADAEFPREVELFLAEELEGYEELEALLLLFQTSTRSFRREEVASALGLGEEAAGEALEHLQRRGLAARESTGAGPRFHYTSQAPDRDDTILALARLYDERRIDIVQRMTANAIARLRTAAIRRFSDAFVLRKDRRDDG